MKFLAFLFVFFLTISVTYAEDNSSINIEKEKVPYKTFDYKSFEDAIVGFKKQIITNRTNVYFYYEGKEYHVAYDPTSYNETTYSFLQIFSSKKFEETLTRYRQMENKKELYIKKFNSFYFLRLRNKDAKFTRTRFLELQSKYPNMYHSRAVKKSELAAIEKVEHTIEFLLPPHEQIQTDTVNEIVVSSKKHHNIPLLDNNYSIPTKQIVREGDLDVLSDLEYSVANFGIVRGDILGLKNSGGYGLTPFTNYGILCSPSEEMLYLVSNKEIKSVYDLRLKTISIGNVSDMAQLYMKKVAKQSGILNDIRFKSRSVEESILLLREKKIDAMFLFAPKSYVKTFLDNGLYISSIPTDFLATMTTKEGLKKQKYKIDGRLVTTLKAPNFVIAPVDTLDSEWVKKIESIAEDFGCMEKLKTPEAFYGLIHPELLNAVAMRNKRLAKQKILDDALLQEQRIREAVQVSLLNTKLNGKKMIYTYQISNNSPTDVNVSFLYIKTSKLDQSPIKAHHLFKNSSRQTLYSVEQGSLKLLSFTYNNPFAIQVKKLPIELLFRDLRYPSDTNESRIMSVPSIIGDDVLASHKFTIPTKPCREKVDNSQIFSVNSSKRASSSSINLSLPSINRPSSKDVSTAQKLLGKSSSDATKEKFATKKLIDLGTSK